MEMRSSGRTFRNCPTAAKTRNEVLSREREGPPLRLFYSYSPIDERLRGELESHPKLLQRRGLIATWHERQVEAGQDRRQQIDENLEHADIILLLVSSDFLASDYCYEMEMMRAFKHNNAGEARVIPVILRDVEWKIAKFSGLQALPKDEVPVMKWPDKDSAWKDVAEGIAKVVVEIRDARAKLELGGWPTVAGFGLSHPSGRNISGRNEAVREKGTSLISTVNEGKEPQRHARKRLMQAA